MKLKLETRIGDRNPRRTAKSWMVIQRNQRKIDAWLRENGTTAAECGLSSAEILKRCRKKKSNG